MSVKEGGGGGRDSSQKKLETEWRWWGRGIALDRDRGKRREGPWMRSGVKSEIPQGVSQVKLRKDRQMGKKRIRKPKKESCQ